MMETLYSTGVRAAGLLGMTVSQIDLKKKVAKIRKKGGSDQMVLLSAPCVRFLARYIEKIRPQLLKCMRPAGNNWKVKAGTGGDTLFLSIYGGPMTGTWLDSIMKGYMKKAGIDRPMSPVHGWRHAAATALLERGMDVRYVQVYLGHNNINSTTIYTHIERKSMKIQIEKFHMRARSAEKFRPFVPGKKDGHDRGE